MRTIAGPVPDQAGAPQQEQEMEVHGEMAMPEATAAAADIDLPEPTANDVFILEASFAVRLFQKFAK